LTPAEVGALGALSAANDLALKEGSSAVGNALGMTIVYGIQAGFSFIIWAGMAFFSNYLPTQVPKLNCCYRLFGGLVRICMNF